VRASSSEHAVSIAEVIQEGGIPILEITMTVPGAVGIIKQLRKRYGDKVLLGAGTVLDSEAAGQCIRAGAQFIVSPSFDVDTLDLCRKRRVAMFPGALTPTEIFNAWQAGADAVKVFPCSAVGGPAYLRALRAPFPEIKLIPTGGVSLLTAQEFIVAGAWALGVGTDLVPSKAIGVDEREAVTTTAGNYLSAIREARSTVDWRPTSRERTKKKPAMRQKLVRVKPRQRIS
jgi:2-dehydro-3-deoxyphosphogluconate aldolase/(4S)-4-hydroxy-2-oxoglutarate aldolase